MNQAHEPSNDLFDVIPLGLAQLDQHLHFVRVNTRFAGLTGQQPSAHIGQRLRELAPILGSQLEPVCCQVLASGEATSVELRSAGRRTDDADQRLLAHCFPLKSAEGAVEGARVVLESITGRQSSSESVRDRPDDDRKKAEALNRAVLNSLRDHVAVVDRRGTVVAVNDAWNRFAVENGANPARLGIDSNYLDVCRRATNNDADASAARALEGIESVLDGSRAHFSMEYRCDSPHEQRCFVMKVVPLQRREGGAVIAHTDITERKTTEQSLHEREGQLRLVVDSLPLLIAYVDAEQRYRLHNLSYRQFFGIRPEAITGHTVREVFGETRYAEIRDHALKALTGERVEFEAAIPDASNEIRHIHGLYVPHVDEGQVYGYFALLWDVTDRVRTEDENRKHREELVHMDRVSMLAGLSASLAHELNQPLTAILNNAQAAQRFLARERPDLAEVTAALADIVADDKRAGEVIRRLRVLLGKSELQVASVQISTVIQEVVSLIHSDALRRRISVSLDLPDDLPPVLGDRIQLQQVLLNLALNAFDAIGKSHGFARTVVLRSALREPDTVIVSVHDTGIGADDGVMQRMFEPFFTTKSDGLGMGLAISRSIIESHGGRIWAIPNGDRGLSVYCSLPVQVTDHE
jgi:PAS domain S-box-containing protein